jgi:hypothetical protein
MRQPIFGLEEVLERCVAALLLVENRLAGAKQDTGDYLILQAATEAREAADDYYESEGDHRIKERLTIATERLARAIEWDTANNGPPSERARFLRYVQGDDSALKHPLKNPYLGPTDLS